MRRTETARTVRCRFTTPPINNFECLRAKTLNSAHILGLAFQEVKQGGTESKESRWGEPVATASDGPGLALAEIDLGRVQEVRRRIPVREHRRLE